ncbi:MAG: ABC transporter permease [Acidimicrobiaceae bacterium]|nr:ABC transporter permease [Acidimicrobiaceae bacterium]MCY4174924.1 ABC transporter permease [Acidimicrobiaceae bacterium]MCY4281092.1 ABC transporter permease [Acidimicrobiaceae bacterium]MCY4295267.1 ABC transporter permease [Acidimicrobiaceae bacterium]
MKRLRARLTGLKQLWRCIGLQNRIFWRTPIAAFFTLVFPILMLVLFTAIFGNDDFDSVYGRVTSSQFYTPGLAVYAAASSTYTGIGITLASRRELGILKRVRGTPLPGWAYLGGVVISAVWIAAVGVTAMVLLGVAAYGVNIEAAKIPAMIVTFAVGTASFAALGLALSSLARSVSMAVPAANATLLPLAFISDIFVPFGSDIPLWLDVLGDIFPLKHFGRAFSEAMSPFSEAPAFEWHRLAILLAWLVVGALVAARKFSWEPPVLAGRTGRRQRRSIRAASPAVAD